MVSTILPVEAARLIPAIDIAVALADEGVPVRAIARSVKIPGEDVYDILKQAIGEGRLISLPKDDWPPSNRKSARYQAENTILSNSDDTLGMACSSYFKMTRLQAAVFVAILRRPEISKLHIHSAIEASRPNADEPTDLKMVDVVICHIRKKLKAIDKEIGIETIWGRGYSLPTVSRDLVLLHLSNHMHPQQITLAEAA
jgi:hypothetical protein